MRVIQNPGTVIKAHSAPGENGRHGVEFEIICFIKHVWETGKYTVGAFVATSYFLSRIPDLSLHAAPLRHPQTGSCAYGSYLEAVLFGQWIATKLFDGWRYCPLTCSAWRPKQLDMQKDSGPGFIKMRGCWVGVGQDIFSLHRECPGVPFSVDHTWMSWNLSLCSGGQCSWSQQRYLLLAAMADNFSLPWLLGTPALHLSFDVASSGSVSHSSSCLTLIRADDAEFRSSQAAVDSREKSHGFVMTWLPGSHLVRVKGCIYRSNLCSLYLMVPPQVLWFRLQMSPKGHVLKAWKCLPKGHMLTAWSPTCGGLEKWWILQEVELDGGSWGVRVMHLNIPDVFPFLFDSLLLWDEVFSIVHPVDWNLRNHKPAFPPFDWFLSSVLS